MVEEAKIFCDIIATYGGRDKIMKVLCYSAKTCATPNAFINADNADKFRIFSSKVSQARATLRLIDDVPTILYALEYGLGRHEKSRWEALLGVVANIVDVLYFPVDKICWLSGHGIIKVRDSDQWDVINSTFWSLSVFLNLIKVVRDFLRKHLAQKTTKTGNEQQRVLDSITVVRVSLDLVHAVSTLPPGCLWGGRIKPWKVGAIGTMSGLLAVYQYVVKNQKSKKL